MGHLTHRNKNHIRTRGAPRTVYYHLPLAHHQTGIGYHSGSRNEFRHEMEDGSAEFSETQTTSRNEGNREHDT